MFNFGVRFLRQPSYRLRLVKFAGVIYNQVQAKPTDTPCKVTELKAPIREKFSWMLGG
jgi:hypothetical protein